MSHRLPGAATMEDGGDEVAVIVEQPAVVDDPVAVEDVPAMPWDAARLLAALDGLSARFALAGDGDDRADLEAEARRLADAGLAPTALLACAAACLARCSDCGPVLAAGTWAASRLLAHCGAVLEPAVGEDEAAGQRAVLQVAPEYPTLLCAEQPDDRFLAALREELAPFALDAILEPGTRYRLRPVSVPGTSLEAEIAGTALVELLPSRLCLGLRLACALREQEHGTLLDPLAPVSGDEAAAALLASSWGALLPELPGWATGELLAAHSSRQLRDRWSEMVPALAPAGVRAALRTRAALLWQLAGLCAVDHAIGWATLAAIVPTERREAVLEAAARAGVPLAAMPGGDDAAPEEPPGGRPSGTNAAGGPVSTRTVAGQAGAPAEVGATLSVAGEALESRVVPSAEGMILLQAVRLADQSVRLLARPLTGGEGPDAAAGAVPSTACVLARAGDLLLAVAADPVAAPLPAEVVVRVALAGDRQADLDRVVRLLSLLEANPGPVPVRVLVERARASRVLERPGSRGVAWSPALARALEDLLGAGRVSVVESAG